MFWFNSIIVDDKYSGCNKDRVELVEPITLKASNIRTV